MITEKKFLKIIENSSEDLAATECFSLAKNMAIEFGVWMSCHRLDFQPATPDGSWIGLNMKTYTTEELFNIYIKEQENEVP